MQKRILGAFIGTCIIASPPALAGDWKNPNDRYKLKSSPSDKSIVSVLNRMKGCFEIEILSLEGKLPVKEDVFELFVTYKSKKGGVWGKDGYQLFRLDTGFWIVRCPRVMGDAHWAFVMKDD